MAMRPNSMTRRVAYILFVGILGVALAFGDWRVRAAIWGAWWVLLVVAIVVTHRKRRRRNESSESAG